MIKKCVKYKALHTKMITQPTTWDYYPNAIASAE